MQIDRTQTCPISKYGQTGTPFKSKISQLLRKKPRLKIITDTFQRVNAGIITKTQPNRVIIPKTSAFDFKKETELLSAYKDPNSEQYFNKIRTYFSICPFDDSHECQNFLKILLKAAIKMPTRGYLYTLSSFFCQLPISKSNLRKLLLQGLKSSITQPNFAFFQPWFLTTYRSNHGDIVTTALINNLISLCNHCCSQIPTSNLDGNLNPNGDGTLKRDELFKIEQLLLKHQRLFP